MSAHPLPTANIHRPSGARSSEEFRRQSHQPIPRNLPGSVLAVPYAPHSLLMPRALVNIHQGGVGTTAQALRAGKPQVVVPFAHDQPDHAARIARYGLGKTVFRDACNEKTLTKALTTILNDPTIATRAAAVGQQVQAEDGVASACAVIEALSLVTKTKHSAFT